MLLGIVGTRCAGKTTVAEILEAEGFTCISLSDILREKAAERHIEPTQDALFSIANELRVKFGPAALMIEALNRADAINGDVAIDTIRTPAEIDFLKKRDDAFVLGVDADFETRYARARQKNGEQEWAASREQFRKHDDASDDDDPSRPNLHEVIGRADVVIDNSGRLETTEEKVREAFETFRRDERSSASP